MMLGMSEWYPTTAPRSGSISYNACCDVRDETHGGISCSCRGRVLRLRIPGDIRTVAGLHRLAHRLQRDRTGMPGRRRLAAAAPFPRRSQVSGWRAMNAVTTTGPAAHGAAAAMRLFTPRAAAQSDGESDTSPA